MAGGIEGCWDREREEGRMGMKGGGWDECEIMGSRERRMTGGMKGWMEGGMEAGIGVCR